MKVIIAASRDHPLIEYENIKAFSVGYVPGDSSRTELVLLTHSMMEDPVVRIPSDEWSRLLIMKESGE